MERAIGVIDSGVGGLTVVHELMRQLPHEKLIYLGDTKRCPYGPRSEEEVREFTFEMVDFLLERDIKMIVVACNTATAFALDALKGKLNIPIIGVIRPGSRAAIKATRNNNIAMIGTAGTIKSNAYPAALHHINREITVTSLACPTFVPMVENGVMSGEEALRTVATALQSLKADNMIDTLILGCTHYPLLEDTIQQVMGSGVRLISSSEETAIETSAILDMHGLLNTRHETTRHQFYTTGNLTLFKQIAQTIFKPTLTNLNRVTIEKVII